SGPPASTSPSPVGASATIANPQVARAPAPAQRNVPPHLAFDLYQRTRAAQAQATAATAPREAPPSARAPERGPGRNDPCPCGSGKKYKKCCGSASGA
ncbi:MAG: SEC-C metal-binding domain-containing protein, partial [Planctomycetota bacterium]